MLLQRAMALPLRVPSGQAWHGGQNFQTQNFQTQILARVQGLSKGSLLVMRRASFRPGATEEGLAGARVACATWDVPSSSGASSVALLKPVVCGRCSLSQDRDPAMQ